MGCTTEFVSASGAAGEILQEYPEEVEHIFGIPSSWCWRCAAAVAVLQCMPSTYNTTIEIRKASVCEPCCDHCSERRKRLFVQDPVTCRCSCKHTDEYCKERQLELNERTCKCDKPRR
ncbi:vascular endothelial growth factor A-A isoform X2 [Lates japonicus]|uniref:Vascular endothelial growth factor A-A isoform X2 n=1 Tax=Lates japonicus TaxID=270547 RepID=A0AAD3MSS8_LATJO|nr:vascular endothelial growth factor A-A isoform X2 [Lates japonicus]